MICPVLRHAGKEWRDRQECRKRRYAARRKFAAANSKAVKARMRFMRLESE